MKLNFLFLGLFALVVMFGIAPSTLAQNANNANRANVNLAQPTQTKSISKFAAPVTGSIMTYVLRAINVLMGLIGSLSVIFIIIGGFRLVVSRGDPAQYKKAKETITWAILGLVVALLAISGLQLVTKLLY